MLNASELTRDLAPCYATQDDLDREWHFAFCLADQQYTTEFAQDFADYREAWVTPIKDMNQWPTLRASIEHWRMLIDMGARTI